MQKYVVKLEEAELQEVENILKRGKVLASIPVLTTVFALHKPLHPKNPRQFNGQQSLGNYYRAFFA
jgi:hypothetical protein